MILRFLAVRHRGGGSMPPRWSFFAKIVRFVCRHTSADTLLLPLEQHLSWRHHDPQAEAGREPCSMRAVRGLALRGVPVGKVRGESG